MDDADRAESVWNAFLERSLARQAEATRFADASENCLRCSEEMPEARRKAVNTRYCFDCANARERGLKCLGIAG